MENEEQLKATFKNYLISKDWKVREEVKRLDAVGWTFSLRADLIICNKFYYPHIGWIGIELKNKVYDEFKQFTKGFHQIVSKYQGNKFEGIEKPVYAWALVTDTEYQHSWTLPMQNLMNRFGVGFFAVSELQNSFWKYRRLNFAYTSPKMNIYFEKEHMPKTDIPTLKKYFKERATWQSKLNKQNLGDGSELQ